MRKQDIFDLLCEDYIIKHKIEEDNFNSCISDFDKCKNDYLIPFIKEMKNKYKLDFDFDLNSNDEIIKNKSIVLFELLCFDFKELISTMPNVFKNKEQEEDYKSAIYFMANNVLMGNIEIYKKYLKTIN